MARNHRRGDIDITKDELNQIKEALDKEEFRKLFIDYFEEINDPANKALYEKEITQLENERGIDVTFIHPKPGFVIKTSVDGTKKAFINVCENDNIGKPSVSRVVQEGSAGFQWSLPYIQAPPRDDIDKNKQLCLVYDVIFHPYSLTLAKKDARIKSLVRDTALSAVEKSYGVVLDRNNLKFPKMDFKGYKHACVIRKKRVKSSCAGPSEKMDEDPLENIANSYYPYSEPTEELSVLTPSPSKSTTEDPYTVPKYLIKYRKNLDMQEFTYSIDAKMNSCVANELIIEIELPLIKSVSDVDLLLSENTLSLKTESPAKYRLKLHLPYSIIEDESSAKFDGTKRKLFVTAVVDRKKHCLNREDSGLESDPSRGLSSSSDEDTSKIIVDNSKSPISHRSNIIQELNCDFNDMAEKDCFSLDSPEDMETEVEPFFSSSCYYSLPCYTIHKTPIGISAHILVKNVEPSSVFHIFNENNSLFQMKFYSMGLGFVLINYAICLKLKATSFKSQSLSLDVFDDFISVSISLNDVNTCSLHSLNIGCDLASMKEEPLPELSPTNSEVCLKTAINADVNNILGSVMDQSGDIVLKLSKLRLYSTAEDDSDDCNEDGTDGIHDNSKHISDHSNNEKAIDIPSKILSSFPIKIEKKIRRTFSESGSPTPMIQRRSILKDTRSLSESSVHDFCAFSLSMESEDGCGSLESSHSKKHVRFNDTVYKKIYRVNSSILGQRKKNQRKAKNKKKAIERQNSESSGISESEVSELEMSELECSEVSDLSEVSDVSETSESDDGSFFEKVLTTPGSKSHRRKGKKNHRKSANTAKIHLYDNEL